MRLFAAIICWLALSCSCLAGSFAAFQNSGYVAPSGSAPVVTNANFNPSTPATSGNTVGTVVATNTPTSWSITAGNSAGDFAISNSGVITFTSQGQTDWSGSVSQKSATLTVQASNASGNGTGIVDVNGYADGSVSAPSGSAQFPTLLSAEPVPPPWMAAGVKYAVGPPSGQTYFDPSTSPPAGTSYASQFLRVNSNNVTINGGDFTLHNGICLLITSGVTGTVVENSKFEVVNSSTPCMINSGSGTGNLTAEYNDFNGNSTNDSSQLSDAINYDGSGTVIAKWNYFHQVWQHGIDFSGTVTPTVEYNLCVDCGIGSNAHPDAWFFSPNTTVTNAVLDFNTVYQTNNVVKGNYGIFSGTDNSISNTSSFSNGDMSFNTVLGTSSGTVGTPITYGLAAVNGYSATTTFTNSTINSNYVDPTNMFGFWYIASGVSNYGSGNTSSGNINMQTGAVVHSPFSN